MTSTARRTAARTAPRHAAPARAGFFCPRWCSGASLRAGVLAVAVVSLGLAAGCTSQDSRRGTTVLTPTGPGGDLARAGERRAEAERLYVLAEEARRDGKPEEAAQYYRASIAQSGDLAVVWNNLGVLYLENENYKDAVSAFTVASRQQPEDPRPLANIALAYREAGWAEDAYDYYNRALEVSPTYLPAIRGAIEAADALGRGTERDLERVREGLLTETDPEWRAFMERQRFRIENRIRLAERAARDAVKD